MHAVNSVGDDISADDSKAIIKDLYSYGLITHKEAKIILAALSDNSLAIKQPEKDILRAKIFKNILVNLI